MEVDRESKQVWQYYSLTKQTSGQNKRHLTSCNIHQEDITILNTQASSMDALSFLNQILQDVKIQTDLNTIIVGAFNTCAH